MMDNDTLVDDVQDELVEEEMEEYPMEEEAPKAEFKEEQKELHDEETYGIDALDNLKLF